MKQSIIFWLLIGFFSCSHPAATNPQRSEILILETFDNGNSDLFNASQSSDVNVSSVLNEGDFSLQIDFGFSEFPSAFFNFDTPIDFTQKSFSFNLINPTTSIVKLRISMISPTGNETFIIILTPGLSKNPNLSFGDEINLGMKISPYDLSIPAYGESGFDLTRVSGVQFWLCQDFQPATILIDNLSILPENNGDRILPALVDQYGQVLSKEWVGKINTDQDLQDHREVELSQLISPEEREYRSSYGGWASQGNLFASTATTYGSAGYFQTYRDSATGKWWLVDPEGYLYLSTGLDIVRLNDMATMIQGREDMFASLSSSDIPSSNQTHWFYASTVHEGSPGWTYNFYSANLERKYGSDWLNQWRNISLKRMATWGFTSLGNWSEPTLFYGKGSLNKFPYTAHVVPASGHDKLSSGSDLWGPTHDPYDPNFESNVRSQALLIANLVQNDPWCMGVFVDNEISWGTVENDRTHFGLILSAFNVNALNRSEGYNAKNAMVEFLRNRYSGNISSLNTAWGSSFSSWESMKGSYNLSSHLNSSNRFSPEVKKDLSLLLRDYGDQYFRTVRDVLKDSSILPHHLYLGSRLISNGAPREIVEAAGAYCDVISINHYDIDIQTNFVISDYLGDVDKPCIIGEFHFGIIGNNHWWSGVVTAENQVNQGQMYDHYMKKIYESDYFVGAHWFQYVDQPNTGRVWDGENGNVGFVSVTDDPHEELVSQATRSNLGMYDYRGR